MARIGEGIDGVRVARLALGARGDGSWEAQPAFAMVRWRSMHGMPHQVYVNGALAGATTSRHQRRMVVPIPRTASAVRVEVFAVADAETAMTQSAPVGFADRARIAWVRDQRLGLDATVRVYHNGGQGEIDVQACVAQKAVWPLAGDKSGFGLAGFGEGDFGWDGGGAVGFGCGAFGCGGFGFDADRDTVVFGELAAGMWRFGVVVVDAGGRACGAMREPGPVAIVPRAKGGAGLRVVSYDRKTNKLVLGG